MIIGEDSNSYLMFNFVRNEDRESLKKVQVSFGRSELHLVKLFQNLLLQVIKGFYEKVLKDYLLNTTIEEVEEKKGLLDIFKKKRDKENVKKIKRNHCMIKQLKRRMKKLKKKDYIRI